jgi:4-amino-4-deoxy-L-arabinose transferase-like glycosyltransferase
VLVVLKNAFPLISPFEKILWVLLLSATVLKVFVLCLVIDNIKVFLEPDTLNTYILVSNDFALNYFTAPGIRTSLDAEVVPVFPALLALPLTLEQTLILIFLISMFTHFLYFKIIMRVFNKNLALIATVILAWEPSFFVSGLRLAPEAIYIFLLVLSISFLILKPFKAVQFNHVAAGILLGLSILTRPIGLVLLLFPTVYLFTKFKKIKQMPYALSIYFSSVLLPFCWSIRNCFVHGFFGVSTITNNNLLLYEGAAAKAEAKNQALEFIQKQELARQQIFLNDHSSVSKVNSYNFDRGLELILSYPVELIQTHVDGLAKLFFGPGRDFYSKVFSNLPESLVDTQRVALLLSVLFLIILNGFAFFGLVNLLRKRPIIAISILALLIPLTIASSGAIAYSRFRSPIAPLICLLAALGIIRFFQWFFDTKSHFSKK